MAPGLPGGRGRLCPPPHHDRSHHPPRGARQDRHLPQRGGGCGPGLLPGPGVARLREVRPGPPRRGHAADHVAHLRGVPHGAPHGGHQGARRPLHGRPSAGGEEDPGAGLLGIHGRGPRPALLLPWRSRLRGGSRGAGRRAQHPRRHRRGGPGGRAAGDHHAAPAPGDHHPHGRKGHPPRPGPAGRRGQARHRGGAGADQGSGRRRGGLRPLHPGRLPLGGAGQSGLRRPHRLGRLHPPNLLHGPHGRAESAQLLRWARPRGHARRDGVGQLPGGQLPRLRGGARRALVLRQVLLPQTGGLARLHRRRRERHLLGRSACPTQRRRRHGHPPCPGSIRGDVLHARRQAGPPHPGESLGPCRGAALCHGAAQGTGRRPGAHRSQRAHAPNRDAARGCRRGRGTTGHVVPPLRHRFTRDH